MTVINTNVASINAQAAMRTNTSAMNDAMERLSTGVRINAASDDAAGLAITDRMTAQIKGLGQAIRNSTTSQQMIDTAEGAQNEVTNILQRLRELSVQSANDTNTALDRTAIQKEADQLVAEIDRISSQTTWNGMSLLDGSFTSKTLQIGADAGQTVSLSVSSTSSSNIGSNTMTSGGLLIIDEAASGTTAMAADSLTVTGSEGTATVTIAANKTAKEVAALFNAETSSTGVSASAVTIMEISANPAKTGGGATPNIVAGGTTFSFTVNGTAVASHTNTETDMRNMKDAINAVSGTTGVSAKMGATNADVILTDADGDNIVIDAFVTGDDDTILFVEMQQEDGETASGTVAADATNEVGHVGILKDDSVSTSDFGMVAGTGVVSLSDTAAFTVVGGDAGVAAGDGSNSHFQGASKTSTLVTVGASDLTTQAGAKSAISAIDGALNQVASRRASLGAISNRIDNTIANLTNINQNVQASRSSILDTDFSVETSQLTKSQILQQAATSMLAQANASKQSVLSLLQG